MSANPDQHNPLLKAIRHLSLKLKTPTALEHLLGLTREEVDNYLQQIIFTNKEIQQYCTELLKLGRTTNKSNKFNELFRFLLQMLTRSCVQGNKITIDGFQQLLAEASSLYNWRENLESVQDLERLFGMLPQENGESFARILPFSVVAQIALILDKENTSQFAQQILKVYRNQSYYTYERLRTQYEQVNSYTNIKQKAKELQELTTRALEAIKLLTGNEAPSSQFSASQLEIQNSILDDKWVKFDTYTLNIESQEAQMLNLLGRIHCCRGSFNEAKEYFGKALEICQQNQNQLEKAAVQINLAFVSYLSAEYNVAQELYDSARNTLESFAVQNQDLLATCYINFSLLLIDAELFSQAEEYLWKAREIRNPEQYSSPLKFATLQLVQGKYYMMIEEYIKARECFDSSLHIRQNIQGSSPDTAAVLYIIGELLYIQNNSAEAENFLVQSLSMRKEHLSLIHYEIGLTYAILGNVLLELDKMDIGYKYLLKALCINKAVLPGMHPNLATVYQFIGNYYLSVDNLEQAQNYLLKCLCIFREILPSEHRNLATIYNDLGYCYQLLSNYSEAKEYYMQSLQIREAVLPQNHRELAITYDSLGHYFLAIADYQEARNYYMKSMMIRKKQGKDNPELAIVYHNLGKVYFFERNFRQAESQYMRCLRMRRANAENSLDLANICIDLGYYYQEINDLEAAEEYFNEGLEIRRKKLGAEHTLTIEIEKVLLDLSANQQI